MTTFAQTQKPVAPEPDPKVLANAIVEISSSFKRLLASGLNRNAIVVLLQSDTGLSKKQINYVLDSLLQLATRYTTLR